MYSRDEISKQRQAFWTTFGKYMQPVPSADGDKVNWINYKTGVQGISFRMNADTRHATIAIVLSHNDLTLQKQHYSQLLQLKGILASATGEDWNWQPLIQDEYGKTTSIIGTQLTGVNLLRNEDWPQLISFFKPRIIALDEFWSNVKYGFEGYNM